MATLTDRVLRTIQDWLDWMPVRTIYPRISPLSLCAATPLQTQALPVVSCDGDLYAVQKVSPSYCIRDLYRFYMRSNFSDTPSLRTSTVTDTKQTSFDVQECIWATAEHVLYLAEQCRIWGDSQPSTLNIDPS